MTTEKLELIDVDKLVPYVNNARTHSESQLKMLQASLREFGFINPVLVDADLNVIAGHGRIMAAKAEGLTQVPCVFVEHLTDAQKRAYILADNRLAEIAGWDEELLKIELDALKELNFDISLTGFDDFKFTESKIEEDNFDVEAELTKPAITQLGDVVFLGRHKIICGDSTKRETYEKLLGNTAVELVISDPPYFVAEENGSGKILNDDLNAKDGYKFLCAAFENFHAALARESAIYIFYATSKTRIFFDAFEDSGFKVLAGLVWKKDTLVPSHGDFQFNHEPIIYGCLKTGAHNFFGDRCQTTVFEFPRIKNSVAEGWNHPSSKPIPLISYLMSLSSKRGDKVLDGFLGSASTLIAAEQLGRICYGIELVNGFVDVAIERYANLVGSYKNIFVERNGEKIPYEQLKTNCTATSSVL